MAKATKKTSAEEIVAKRLRKAELDEAHSMGVVEEICYNLIRAGVNVSQFLADDKNDLPELFEVLFNNPNEWVRNEAKHIVEKLVNARVLANIKEELEDIENAILDTREEAKTE